MSHTKLLFQPDVELPHRVALIETIIRALVENVDAHDKRHEHHDEEIGCLRLEMRQFSEWGARVEAAVETSAVAAAARDARLNDTLELVLDEMRLQRTKLEHVGAAVG